MPPGWNPDIAPAPGIEPSCWVIDVSGNKDGMKLNADACIVLTKRAHEQCLKFRDLKVQKWGKCPDNECFFVNFNGGALAPFKNTKGSIFQKFGKAAGISNPTTNSFRRAAEVVIQKDPRLKNQSKSLQSHSTQVGSKHYDKSGVDVRCTFVTSMNERENADYSIEEIPDSVKRKRDDLDREDHDLYVQNAIQLLEERKKMKFVHGKLSRNRRLLAVDRLFIQEWFKTLIDGKFPGKKLVTLSSFNFCILRGRRVE